MPVFQPTYVDPFSPVLKKSEKLELSDEQRFYVHRILLTACSDTRFAEKAYDAIQFVLTGGSVVTPVVTSLSPATATLGDPSFTLSVSGTGFGVESVIVWNGSLEPTTYVSDTELTTGVDMSTATTAMDIPVMVVTGLGVVSNVMTFSLTAPAVRGGKMANETPGKPTQLPSGPKDPIKPTNPIVEKPDFPNKPDQDRPEVDPRREKK